MRRAHSREHKRRLREGIPCAEVHLRVPHDIPRHRVFTPPVTTPSQSVRHLIATSKRRNPLVHSFTRGDAPSPTHTPSSSRCAFSTRGLGWRHKHTLFTRQCLTIASPARGPPGGGGGLQCVHKVDTSRVALDAEKCISRAAHRLVFKVAGGVVVHRCAPWVNAGE